MATLSTALIFIIIFLHMYFLILEMFLWESPFGRKTFSMSTEFAKRTKSLAANQGLYNGFLAIGLLWSILPGENSHSLKIFFLSCILIAGLFGGFTVNKKIFWIQALPAAIALALLLVPVP